MPARCWFQRRAILSWSSSTWKKVGLISRSMSLLEIKLNL